MAIVQTTTRNKKINKLFMKKDTMNTLKKRFIFDIESYFFEIYRISTSAEKLLQTVNEMGSIPKLSINNLIEDRLINVKPKNKFSGKGKIVSIKKGKPVIYLDDSYNGEDFS